MSNISRLLFFLVLVSCLAVGAAAAHAGESKNCITCHSNRTIIQKGGHLYVDPEKYAVTTHARIGCVSCHDKVSKRHPADGIRPSRATCQECHAPIFEEYAKSLHGNKAGCVDCHNPHAVKPPIAVAARDINTQCAKCHENSKTVKSHSKWLTQAALHLDALPCITCHTGSKNYVITMYLAKNASESPVGGADLASYEDLKPFLSEGKKIGTLIDVNDDGFITLNELIKFNKNSRYKSMSLLGTMMPEVVTHSYQILNNRWDCTFCHASGPKAMQQSYVAFPEKNDMYSRIAVEKGAILDILYGTPDFYMLGATRSNLLSIIGAVIAAGGLMVPIAHGTLRFLTRKKRKEHN